MVCVLLWSLCTGLLSVFGLTLVLTLTQAQSTSWSQNMYPNGGHPKRHCIPLHAYFLSYEDPRHSKTTTLPLHMPCTSWGQHTFHPTAALFTIFSRDRSESLTTDSNIYTLLCPASHTSPLPPPAPPSVWTVGLDLRHSRNNFFRISSGYDACWAG